MIIYDHDTYKLDATWSKSTTAGSQDWWLEFTSFRKKTETEWTIKTTRLSPEAQITLCKIITEGPPSA